MAALVKQMMAAAASGLPQGFVRLRIKGDELVDEMAQLVITRTGAQGGPEYLRAYNSAGRQPVDATETIQYRWGADEGRVVPYAVRLDGHDLVLDIGRNVNALLDQQSNYRLVLIQKNLPVPRECTLAWTRVPPVRPGDLASFVPHPDAPRSAPPVPPVDPTVAPPAQPPAPQVQTPAPVGGHSEQSLERPRWVLPALGAGALLLVLAGVAAYWLLWPEGPGQTAQVPPALTSKPSAEAPSSAVPPADPPATGAPTARTVAPPPAETRSPTETREQRLARVIAQGPDAAIDAGRQAQTASEIDEAEFLFRNACDRGRAEGCRLAAQLFDPLDLSAGRSTQRSSTDAKQAVSLYRRAIEAGSADAEKDLARLRSVIERAAQDGDSAAKVILDTWPRKP